MASLSLPPLSLPAPSLWSPLPYEFASRNVNVNYMFEIVNRFCIFILIPLCVRVWGLVRCGISLTKKNFIQIKNGWAWLTLQPDERLLERHWLGIVYPGLSFFFLSTCCSVIGASVTLVCLLSSLLLLLLLLLFIIIIIYYYLLLFIIIYYYYYYCCFFFLKKMFFIPTDPGGGPVAADFMAALRAQEGGMKEASGVKLKWWKKKIDQRTLLLRCGWPPRIGAVDIEKGAVETERLRVIL